MADVGPIFAAEVRRRRAESGRAVSPWRWPLDELFLKSNGESHDPWRAIHNEGEVMESFATKTCDRQAALKSHKKVRKRHRRAEVYVTVLCARVGPQ